MLREHEITLQGGFAVVFRDGHAVEAFHLQRPGGGQATVKPWIPAPAVAKEDTPDERAAASGAG